MTSPSRVPSRAPRPVGPSSVLLLVVGLVVPLVAVLAGSGAATAQATAPRITVSSMAIRADYSADGVSVQTRTRIRNTATSTGARRTMRLSLVGPAPSTSRTFLREVGVNPIAGRSSKTINPATGFVPDDLPQGSYRLEACLPPFSSNCTLSLGSVRIETHFAARPDYLGFGERPLGGTYTGGFTVVNDGVGTAVPQLELRDDPRFDSPDYSFESYCDEPLAPGQGCAVLVRWRPTTTGFHRNAMTIVPPGPSPLFGGISFEGYVDEPSDR